MTFHRREVLGTLGVAGAEALLWAFGCGAPTQVLRRAPQVSGEVRTWLHDAVSRLATVYPTVHALAVSRRRTTAARDVLGAGVARLHAEGVVLTVRNRDGAWRDHVTSELTRDGVDAAAHALGAARRATHLDFGRAPPTPDEPPRISDRDLLQRVELLLRDDPALAPRIVYAAGAIDLDDAIVWSVAPGRDLEQRLVRIRQTAIRAAGSGSRPVVRQTEHAWSGGIDDQHITPDDLTAVSEAALQVITPGDFDDGERSVVLDPSVVAVILDTAACALLTSAALRRPEVTRRLAGAPTVASPVVTLIDDPTTPAAYGAFAFDDEGQPAAPIVLIESGRITGRLSDRAGASIGIGIGGGGASGGGASGGTAGRGRRPGHLGHVEPSPSHLRLVPGTIDVRRLFGDGFLLEGGVGATLDPTGTRVRVSCTHARELKAGNTTGKLYADVELVGSLATLLSDIDAVAATPVTFALRGPSDRNPTWRSISTPAVRTRGLVRARRSRA